MGHHDRRPSFPVDRSAECRRPRPDDAQNERRTRAAEYAARIKAERALASARTVLTLADHFDDRAEVLVSVVSRELA